MKITLDYREYQALNSEVTRLKKYIHDTEVEKKIKVEKIHHYSYSQLYTSLARQFTSFNNIDELYSKEEIDELKADASGIVIIQAAKAASELQEIRKELQKILNMGFMRRILFIFAGGSS